MQKSLFMAVEHRVKNVNVLTKVISAPSFYYYLFYSISVELALVVLFCSVHESLRCIVALCCSLPHLKI